MTMARKKTSAPNAKTAAFIKKKAQEALELARETKPKARNWMQLHNRIFGVGGFVAENLKVQEERSEFLKTDECKEIHKMIDDWADETDPDSADSREIEKLTETAKGALSIRVPKSVHAALLVEAKNEGVSLNQLCLAKLCVQLRAVM